MTKHIFGYLVIIVVALYIGSHFGNKIPFIGTAGA